MGYDLPTGKREHPRFKKHIKKCIPMVVERTTIISNAIGQGEVLMTPIQLANMMATANEGYYTLILSKE
jgi:penicillin-binding protein 2